MDSTPSAFSASNPGGGSAAAAPAPVTPATPADKRSPMLTALQSVLKLAEVKITDKTEEGQPSTQYENTTEINNLFSSTGESEERYFNLHIGGYAYTMRIDGPNRDEDDARKPSKFQVYVDDRLPNMFTPPDDWAPDEYDYGITFTYVPDEDIYLQNMYYGRQFGIRIKNENRVKLKSLFALFAKLRHQTISLHDAAEKHYYMVNDVEALRERLAGFMAITSGDEYAESHKKFEEDSYPMPFGNFKAFRYVIGQSPSFSSKGVYAGANRFVARQRLPPGLSPEVDKSQEAELDALKAALDKIDKQPTKICEGWEQKINIIQNELDRLPSVELPSASKSTRMRGVAYANQQRDVARKTKRKSLKSQLKLAAKHLAKHQKLLNPSKRFWNALTDTSDTTYLPIIQADQYLWQVHDCVNKASTILNEIGSQQVHEFTDIGTIQQNIIKALKSNSLPAFLEQCEMEMEDKPRIQSFGSPAQAQAPESPTTAQLPAARTPREELLFRARLKF